MNHEPRLHLALPQTPHLRHYPRGMTPAETACLDLLDRIEALERRIMDLEKQQEERMKDEDLFKPLSAKAKKPQYSISGRLIENQSVARAASDKKTLAAIRQAGIARLAAKNK